MDSLARASIRADLATWSTEHGRRPPWRKGADEYRLAVAEILLQKTRAVAVVPVWRRVTETFPSATDLAGAPPDALLAAVAPLGLGLQRRDRLQAMARALCRGEEQLPGLGTYGQSVIDLVLGRPAIAVPVDGNVARVLSRVLGVRWTKGEARKKPMIRDAARDLLSGPRPLETLYGLVDLGALVCLPARPRCPSCPIRPRCASALS